MTVEGCVNKTIILSFIVLGGAMISWTYAYTFSGLLMVMAILGFATAMFTIWKPQYSNISAPLYAVFEGLFLGAISFLFNSMFPGIVMQAVMLTLGVLFLMLFLYKSRIIKVTAGLRAGIIMATGAIALVYIITLVLGLFGISIPYIHSNGWIGIGFSVVVVGIASFNLLLDFDFFEKGSASGAPKYMEWYAAFGLMVTLIWLYLEILRLLAKLRSR